MIRQLAVMTRNLVKRYGQRRALDGFTIAVPFGCILGLVGANGAGKTTWMMSVAGLVRTDAGEISHLERGPFDARIHSGRVSILPEDSGLPLEATPEGFLFGLGLERIYTYVAFVEAGRVTRFCSLTELTADGTSLETAYLNRHAP